MPRVRSVIRYVTLLSTLGCIGSTGPSDAAVRFRMESETCGGPITFQASIDDDVIGPIALRDGQESEAFRIAPGTHRFRAAIVPGSFQHDTTITLGAGERGTVLLSPYCS